MECAEKFAADPKDWSFATSARGQIKSVAMLFRLTYEMQGGSITIRTALIVPNGQLVHRPHVPPKTLVFFRSGSLRYKTPRTLVVHWRADFASMSPLRHVGSRAHIVFGYRNSTVHSRMT